VYPGIRTSRRVNRRALLRKFFENIRKRALHRDLPGLHLPAAEIGAVIGNDKFYVSHANEKRWNHGCTRMSTDKN
jgi:hypothetical protein